MILYYAAGGGLGHLTRARAVIHTLGAESVALLTASAFAFDKRVVGEMPIIHIPQNFSADIGGYRNWLGEVFEEIRPTKIFLDTFPCGILGEFCEFDFPKGAELFHIARILRWAEYENVISGAPPVFQSTFLVEPLTEDQEYYLQAYSKSLNFLKLTDPPAMLNEAEKDFVRRLQESWRPDLRPCWFIIHSGSLEEMDELLAYAKEMSEQERVNPRLILIAPKKIALWNLGHINGRQSADFESLAAVEMVDFYPASVLFPFADRLISACGFNVMRQTESYQEKHRFLPFARRFDNQFLRAARRKGSKQNQKDEI